MREYGSFIEGTYNSKKNILSIIGECCNFGLFRSGRDILSYIAACHKNRKNLIMPEYFCESMIKPFENNNFEVLFYALNADFSPCTNKLFELVNIYPDAILMLVDYYGYTDFNPLKIQIKEFYPNLLIIEDATHDLNKILVPNNAVDFTLCSLRKWLPIPDGAICVSNTHSFEILEDENNFFTEQKRMAMREKTLYLSDKSTTRKEKFLNLNSIAENFIAFSSNPVGISKLSQIILSVLDIEAIIEKRKYNYTILDVILRKTLSKELLLSPNPGGTFMYPLYLDNRNEIQQKLAKKGLYSQILWPQYLKTCMCSHSKKFYDKLLAIPIDQRYSSDDMDDIAHILIETLK